MTSRTTLLETIRIKEGTAPLWGLHLARLYRSCKELGVAPPMSLWCERLIDQNTIPVDAGGFSTWPGTMPM